MKRSFASILAVSLIVSTGMSGANAAPTILALGDSITAGAPDFKSAAEAPPAGRGDPKSQYAYWVQQQYPEWSVVNRGVSGQTSEDILRRLERELDQTQPQMVILMAGVNDIYRGNSPELLRANLQKIYQIIQNRGIPLMVLTILPYRGLTPQKNEILTETNRWIQLYAERHQLGFCDTYEVLRSHDDPLTLLSTQDGLHPDSAGYRVMGRVIAETLAKWKPFQTLSR